MSLASQVTQPLVKAILEEFHPRFTPRGVVVWVAEDRYNSTYCSRENMVRLGLDASSPIDLPNVIIYHWLRDWMAVLDVASIRGPVKPERREELRGMFSGRATGVVYFTVLADRAELQSSFDGISWGTDVWIAEEPDHLIHFDGERFLGPYPEVLPLSC